MPPKFVGPAQPQGAPKPPAQPQNPNQGRPLPIPPPAKNPIVPLQPAAQKANVALPNLPLLKTPNPPPATNKVKGPVANKPFSQDGTAAPKQGGGQAPNQNFNNQGRGNIQSPGQDDPKLATRGQPGVQSPATDNRQPLPARPPAVVAPSPVAGLHPVGAPPPVPGPRPVGTPPPNPGPRPVGAPPLAEESHLIGSPPPAAGPHPVGTPPSSPPLIAPRQLGAPPGPDRSGGTRVVIGGHRDVGAPPRGVDASPSPKFVPGVPGDLLDRMTDSKSSIGKEAAGKLSDETGEPPLPPYREPLKWVLISEGRLVASTISNPQARRDESEVTIFEGALMAQRCDNKPWEYLIPGFHSQFVISFTAAARRLDGIVFTRKRKPFIDGTFSLHRNTPGNIGNWRFTNRGNPEKYYHEFSINDGAPWKLREQQMFLDCKVRFEGDRNTEEVLKWKLWHLRKDNDVQPLGDQDPRTNGFNEAVERLRIQNAEAAARQLAADAAEDNNYAGQ